MGVTAVTRQAIRRLTAVDGQAIRDVAELQGIIAQAKLGDKVELTILHDGQEMQVTVTLGE